MWSKVKRKSFYGLDIGMNVVFMKREDDCVAGLIIEGV